MDKLKELIKMVADTFEKEIPLIEECTIISVDKTEKTCICKSNKRDTTIENVKLSAIKDIGFTQYPKVDSVVIICELNYTKFILLASEIEKFEIEFDNSYFSVENAKIINKIGNSELTVTNEGFKIESNGTNLGTLLTDLTTAITKITATVVNIGSQTAPITNISEFTALLPQIKQLLK